MTSGLVNKYGQPLSPPSVLPYRPIVGMPDWNLDPIGAYAYLYHQRDVTINAVNQRPLLRLWDENHNPIGTIGQEQSVVVEEVMADSGTGSCVIRYDNWLSDFILFDRRVEQDLHFTLDPIPTQRGWRTRWGGKITDIDAKRDASGLHTVELQMMHNREHAKHILAGANPVLPPEIQFPKMWLFPWNCRTALTISGIINLARQYEPFLAIPDNILNPFGWVESLTSSTSFGINPLSWPIQFQFINILLDQSRTEVFSSKWNNFHDASLPSLTDAGCMLRAYTWLTEDADSPHPELADLAGTILGGVDQVLDEFGLNIDLAAAGESAFRPTRNCIVLAVEDKSGVTGPTGTLFDGPLNLIANTLDDGITDTIIADPSEAAQFGLADTESPTGITPIISQWFDVAPAPPKVIFGDGEFSGIITSSRSQHGALAKTIMTGSRSPGWVNDLQTFGIRYALAQLSEVIDMGPLGATNVPGSLGLDNLYNGELDDVLLAYQRFTDPIRAIYMGDMAFLEHFESGSGTAYTISGEIALANGRWKTRAHTSFKTSVRNGPKWLFNTDYTLGDRLGFMMANAIYVDQCSGYRLSYNETQPLTLDLTIGTDHADGDPMTQVTTALASAWNLVGAFMGSSELF